MNRAKRFLPWIVIAVVLVLLALLVRRPQDGDPLDPRSTRPTGAKAIVDLLDRMGASVTVSRTGPNADTETMLLLADRLGTGARREVDLWVRAGGTLVVTDPTSAFSSGFSGANPLASAATAGDRLNPQCELASVQQVGSIDPAGGIPLVVPDQAVGCFPLRSGHLLVARGHGEGNIVSIGGAAPFLNHSIGEADNAVLAVGLLAPRDGSRVVVFDRPLPGAGAESLSDLVPVGIKLMLLQLAIAFVVYAAARSRRLGTPVLEPQAVEIPASDLVVAVGNLLQVARHRESAAAMLRDDLRRTLAERFGLPADSHPDLVVAAARDHAVLPADRIAAVLAAHPLSGDDDLVALAQLIESVRQEVTRVRS